MGIKIHALLSLGLVFMFLGANGQTEEMPLDPAGFVTKYDTSFAGIGPRVYTLPQPRSKQEVLVDSYQEKKGFYDSISRGLDLQILKNDFKFTQNSGYIKNNFKPLPANEEEWNALITKLEQNNNTVLAAGLANEYAWVLLQANQSAKSIELLTRGLNALNQSGLIAEKSILEYNLANAYLFSGNYAQASSLQERFLATSIKNNTILDQANTLVKIGMVNAYLKNYLAAENTIIRRAIPLYNKSKNYSGKVNAWIKLAKIYQLQNKHVQAQWFLIQAKDLAHERKIEVNLPDIEYML
ncbi:MAG: tetratricopeptide repeat protein, partial [Sphingobacterium sp.]